MKLIRHVFLFFTVALTVGLTAGHSSSAFAADDPVYTGTFSNTAVGGYDTVAYFTEQKPVKGSSKYTSEYMGADFKFSSAANKALFDAKPAAYAPQYGGYCAYAVSQGSTASGDPKLWKVENGKLYLNYNRKVRDTWLKDIPGYVALADGNWPKVLE